MKRGYTSGGRAIGAVADPGPGIEPGKSNGGHGSETARELWQVFVPLGQPVEFFTAYERANAVPLAFVVPVQRAA